MRKALIEVARQESNERRMDPGIGVEAVYALNPVSMPNRNHCCRSRWLAGAADRPEAGLPEAVHCPPLLAGTIVQVAENGRRGPGVRRHVGPKQRQRRGFLENPGQLSTGCGRNAVQHDGAPKIEAGAY